MKKEENKNSRIDNIVQHYLDELAKIRLLDQSTLKRLHKKIDANAYFDQKIFNSISQNILNDTTLN